MEDYFHKIVLFHFQGIHFEESEEVEEKVVYDNGQHCNLIFVDVEEKNSSNEKGYNIKQEDQKHFDDLIDLEIWVINTFVHNKDL